MGESEAAREIRQDEFPGCLAESPVQGSNNLISVTDIPLCLNTLEVHGKAECEVGLKSDAWVFPQKHSKGQTYLTNSSGLSFLQAKEKKKIVPSSRA